MRVCILMGSMRLNLNTAELCKPFMDELRLHGTEVEYITLQDKKIAPCLGCYQCQHVADEYALSCASHTGRAARCSASPASLEYGCPQQDDMQAIVESIVLADILVFATPIYTWQATPPLKAVMDRMYGLNKFYGPVPRKSLNANQAYALIATCGYDLDYGAELLDEGFRRWCQHSGLPYLGMYAVRDEDDLASFQTEAAINGARAFAQHIIAWKTGNKAAITHRRYDILADFSRVYQFLEETYDFETLNSYLLPQYFEYAHYLQWFDYIRAHCMGLWEENNRIVGIAAYEMSIGQTHLHTDHAHAYLLPEMLQWAEKEISVFKDGKHCLEVWLTSKEPEKQKLLKDNGYQFVYSEPVNIFRYEKDFVERELPVGYGIIDGTAVDYAKLAECFWRGFDHDEVPPEENIDGNIKSLHSPHADKTLMTVITAPNGEYACALGMWFDKGHKYAYLEPLATVPQYRRKGLATVALTEAMKKTKALGAAYCFGGGGAFYTAIGFETICHRELWKKEW